MKRSMNVMNYLILACTTLVFFSCNKDDMGVPDDAGTEKRVTMKVATLQSRAQESHVPTGTATAIEDAVVLFYNAADAQVFSHEFTTAELTTLASSEVIIRAIPASATKVAMIANYKASGQGTSYSGVTGTSQIEVANLHPATGVAKVIMYGTGAISGTATTENTYPATITISPIASRLEVSGIGTKKAGGTFAKGEIKSYTLVGVFVPNHYPTGTIAEATGSSATGAGVLVKPTDPAAYTNSFPATSGAGRLRDYNSTALVLTGDLFGYNMFPAVGAANLPNVVIAVKDIVYVADDAGSEATLDNGSVKYVTVSEFYTDVSHTTALTQFKNANVYGIEGLLFGLEDLGDTPYTKAKNVAVTVVITPWTYLRIYPGI